MMQHALAAGRYRWWHDQVLVVVVEMVQQEVMRSRKRGVEEEEEAQGREVLFVKESQVVRGGKQEVCQMYMISRWWNT